MINLSSTQRQTLRTWFEDVYACYDRFDFPIHFIRVIAGDKPATFLQQFEWKSDESPFDTDETFLAFVEDLGLLHHQHTMDQNYSICQSSRELHLLQSIPHSRSKKEQHRKLGAVYGYPNEDVEWFIRDRDRGRITSRKRVENGDFDPEEMAYTDLVAYKHDDSIKGYERAIEEGKRIRDLLSDVAAEWDIPVIKEIAEDHYQLSVDVYSGERKHFPGEYIGFRMATKNPALD